VTNDGPGVRTDDAEATAVSRGWRIAGEALARGANQKLTELAPLLDLLDERDLGCVVEIGTERGGTLYAWCQVAAPDALVVSIDLPGGPYGGGYTEEDAERFREQAQPGQELHFLRSDSHDPATVAALEEILAGRPIDFLFIDGDHTYYGARKDFELYSPFVAEDGLVALHDILPHAEFPDVKVDVVWRELKQRAEHVEELVDPDSDRGWGPWGGIGVLFGARQPVRRRSSVPLAAGKALMEDVERARAETAELHARIEGLAREREEVERERESLARERDETASRERELAERLDEQQRELARRVEEHERDLARRAEEHERELEALGGRLEELAASSSDAERERDEVLERVAELGEELTAERRWAREQLEIEQARTEGVEAALAAEVQRGHDALALIDMIYRTRGWRLLEKYRAVVTRARGRRTEARARVGETVAALRPAPPQDGPAPDALRRYAGAAGRDIVFDRPAEPTVSIVIPVFNNVGVTLACLASLAENTPHELIEVIVVDDVSTDSTPEALAQTTGLTAIRNEHNLGFTQTCNRGAAAASGKYVLFLNNDVEVQPGWLEPLLDAAESGEDVGAVGSKLVYPDGTLQEAGAIVWSDGQAWNFGRGGDPEAPEFNYRREVDYCSAAALLVRRDLLERLGGFDVRFSPGYCEDSDLCFTMRAEGYRVLYEPRSVVVHNEGATHGTDASPGVEGSPHAKSSQYRNQYVFARKWKRELARQRPPGTKLGQLGGRTDRRPRVLVCDMWIPAHDRDSGSRRMTWILTKLRELGCAVTYFNTDRQHVEPYVSLLQREGIEVYYGPRSFTEFAQERSDQFDLVFLSRPNVAYPLFDDVGRYFPLAPVVYDISDLGFVREQRKADVLGGPTPREIARLREEEVTCVRRSDVTTGPSQADVDVMRGHVPDGRFFVLPNAHELDDAEPLPFDERPDLVFIGGFNHDPNVDSALWLVNDILPLVREEVDARLWLLGSHPSDAVRALASRDVIVPGSLPEAEVAQRFREGRVFLAPLRYGAGIKGKIGHAMAFALPVVTTEVGAEGMELVDGENVLVRESAEDFARAVIDVYSDRELWERLSRASRATVEERWTPEAMQGRLQRLLRETLELRTRALAGDGSR
jgi:GT2 family glycosyltransferase/glycosyltransferase involved in cell wall biosynthesis/cephalosporin hydroxylase